MMMMVMMMMMMIIIIIIIVIITYSTLTDILLTIPLFTFYTVTYDIYRSSTSLTKYINSWWRLKVVTWIVCEYFDMFILACSDWRRPQRREKTKETYMYVVPARRTIGAGRGNYL